jgi:hypothetical protein
MNKKPFRNRPKHRTLLLGTLLASGASLAMGQEAGKLDQLEKENVDLRKRLEALEAMAQKEGIMPSGDASPAMPIKAMSEMMISGFVTASYFYDTRTPKDNVPDGYLWNQRHNSFSINKVKLTIASPAVERSGSDWDAGYRASLIFGENANAVNTGGELQGLEALREAYVEINAPLGTGLNIKAGQLISLLNYESGDGGAANANFSQGYQWYYTGNGPSAGVQLGYTFTDWMDLKVRVQNGMYAGAVDGNNGKTAMASLGLKPDSKTWINLIGFGGDESSSQTVKGGSILAGRQMTEKFGLGLELDYFHFNPPGPSAELMSAGAWVTYDFTPKFGIALRGEYLSDPDGGGLKGILVGGRAGSAITSTEADGNLASLTLTFNWRPTPNIKVQPEVRYDTTSYDGGFDGKTDRVIVGAGVSYLF